MVIFILFLVIAFTFFFYSSYFTIDTKSLYWFIFGNFTLPFLLSYFIFAATSLLCLLYCELCFWPILPVLPIFLLLLLLSYFYLFPIDLWELGPFSLLFLFVYSTFSLCYPGTWNFLWGFGAFVWFLRIIPSSSTKVLASVFCIICFILPPFPFFAPKFILTSAETLEVLDWFLEFMSEVVVVEIAS